MDKLNDNINITVNGKATAIKKDEALEILKEISEGLNGNKRRHQQGEKKYL